VTRRTPGLVARVATAVAVVVITAACGTSEPGPIPGPTAAAPPSHVRQGHPAHRGVPVVGPACDAATGRVEHVTFEASSFAERGDFQLYLPPCYDTETTRRYPVLYLLHGGSQDDDHWSQLGLPGAADAAIAAHSIAPMIVVMPDGGPMFAPKNRTAFEHYLVHDLVPRVDRTWRTSPERSGRAVGGISIGGRLALEAATDHPQLFSVVGAHSSTVRDVPGLARRLADGDLRIYLDVGNLDALRGVDQSLADALDRDGAHYEFHVSPGAHGRVYWSAHVRDYLRFYDAALASC
jgi:enterochelin esterase-like enzyme